MGVEVLRKIRAFAITPSDTLPLTDPVDNKIIGGSIKCTGSAGNVAFTDGTGNARLYPIAAGELLDVYANKVLSTGTTATALWCFASE